MKNRKFVVVAFMLVAVLVLGIGYAAVADTLDVQGTLKVSQANADANFELNVYFEGAEFVEASSALLMADGSGNTCQVNASDNDIVDFLVEGFAAEGDYLVAKCTIKNDSDIDAVAYVDDSGNTHLGNTTVFDMEHYFLDGSSQVQNIELAAGATVDLYVKLSVIESVTVDTSSNFNVAIGAIDAASYVPAP